MLNKCQHLLELRLILWQTCVPRSIQMSDPTHILWHLMPKSHPPVLLWALLYYRYWTCPHMWSALTMDVGMSNLSARA